MHIKVGEEAGESSCGGGKGRVEGWHLKVDGPVVKWSGVVSLVWRHLLPLLEHEARY